MCLEILFPPLWSRQTPITSLLFLCIDFNRSQELESIVRWFFSLLRLLFTCFSHWESRTTPRGRNSFLLQLLLLLLTIHLKSSTASQNSTSDHLEINAKPNSQSLKSVRFSFSLQQMNFTSSSNLIHDLIQFSSQGKNCNHFTIQR